MLYGLIDTGFVYNSNSTGHRQYELVSGNLQGSRWGIRGQEDLGGGYKTLFRLEGGYTLTNGALGQGGSIFGRVATVGASTPQGDFNIGRQYDPMTIMIAKYTAVGAEGHGEVTEWAGVYGAHPQDLDNLGGSNRTNNSIRYASPNWNGMHVGAFYSLGGKAGDFTGNQIYSMAATYEHGPFSAGVGYLNARDPNYSFFGNKPNSNTVTSASSANMSGPLFSGFASAHSEQILAGGALYELGFATIQVEFSNVQLQNIGSEAGSKLNPLGLKGSTIYNVAELSGEYHLTPTMQIGASYSHTNRSPIGPINSAKYDQFDLEADYALSSATDLYLVGVYQRANGKDSTGKAAVAAIDALTASSTDRQAAATFGIRHRF